MSVHPHVRGEVEETETSFDYEPVHPHVRGEVENP